MTSDLCSLPYPLAEDEDQPSKAILNKLQKDAAGRIRLGLDLQGGVSFTVAMETNVISADRNRQEVMEQAIGVLNRVDKFGVAEPVLQTRGRTRNNDRDARPFRIGLPVRQEILTRPAYLEFRMVHERSQELLARGFPVPGYEVLTERRKSEIAGEADALVEYLVKREPEQGLTGTHIERAAVYPNPMTGEPEIDFTLTSEGAALFASITRANVGRQLAIVLDGELKSACDSWGYRAGRGQISGDYDVREAIELANVLENPLEAPVRIVEESSTGPTLGRDSIEKGVRASLWGMIAVAVFMLIYYAVTAGLIANVALCLNLIILLGVLCNIDATLTLPGIAGIVLTVGMAVDANVLIFERIREELRHNKSVKGAISAGFSKAFGTIIDANVTTLIASVILIYMGKGPVKGFGVTLTIGIVASLFTAFFVTKLFFATQFFVRDGAKSVSIGTLACFNNSRFDFM